MLKPGAHYGSSGTVFSVLNDVHAIASALPRVPTFNEMAIMRSSADNSPDDFRYSPYKVLAAMGWLSENNHLYENISVRPDGTEWENLGQLEPISVPHIETSEDDCDGITSLSSAAGADGHPVNPSAPDAAMTDVFLMPNSNEDKDLVTQVEKIVESSTRASQHKATRVTHRTPGALVRDYETPDFIQRAFVNLFPFGRGGPDPATECQPDMHLAEIYDNAITSANPLITTSRVPWYASLDEKQEHSDRLDKSQRAKLLRDHPYLSARIHAAQQTAFWDYIVYGKSKPFGEVTDSFRRVEFQGKGTPHSHNMMAIKDEAGSVENPLLDLSDEPAVESVLNMVESLATARLQPRLEGDLSDLPNDVSQHAHVLEDELQYDYTIDRNSYFRDSCHPCRVRFVATGKDFNYDKATGVIHDKQVQRHTADERGTTKKQRQS
eukprot:gene29121-36113_t